MADNVTLPVTGTGTADVVTATDDVAGVHYQYVKLADGTLDSTAKIGGDATNGLDVDVTRLPALVAGNANIGDVDIVTVPAPLSTTGGGTEATAHRVTIASDSTGVLTVKQSSSVNLKAQVGGFAADGTALTGNPVLVAGSDGTNAQSLSTNASGELAVNVQTIAAGNNNIGDVDIASIAAGDNNIGNVDVVTLPNVTLAAGTNTNEVVGDVAHGSAAAGNPVLTGGFAEAMADSAPGNRTNMSASDVGRYVTDLDGVQFVHPHGPQIWSYHENSSSALTDTTVHASPGAGLSLYVTDIVCSTGAATALNIFFEEGTTTTVLGPYYLEAVAGRGFALHFITPKKITAATSLTVTTSGAIAHSIDVTGYVAPG